MKKSEAMEFAKILTDGLTDEDIYSAMILSDVSNAIMNKRLEMKMNQEQFAKFLNVSQGMVSRWENGGYNFSLSTIIKIYYKLGLPLEFDQTNLNNKKEDDKQLAANAMSKFINKRISQDQACVVVRPVAA